MRRENWFAVELWASCSVCHGPGDIKYARVQGSIYVCTSGYVNPCHITLLLYSRCTSVCCTRMHIRRYVKAKRKRNRGANDYSVNRFMLGSTVSYLHSSSPLFGTPLNNIRSIYSLHIWMSFWNCLSSNTNDRATATPVHRWWWAFSMLSPPTTSLSSFFSRYTGYPLLSLLHVIQVKLKKWHAARQVPHK